jgi:phosphatidate phosphatase APP1
MGWQEEMASDAALLRDEFGRSFVYTKVTEGAFNTSTGARGKTTVTHTVTMIPSRVTVTTEAVGRSNRRVENRTFAVPVAAMTALAIVPDLDDTIADVTGNPWIIKNVDRAMEDTMYHLVCARSAT